MRRWCALLWLAATSCLQTRYIAQAGVGQMELVALARPVRQVIDDEHTDERTRALLREAQRVLVFARTSGLQTKGNYSKFVDLGRESVVWFVAAAPSLSLEPKIWNFPLVGSFPYLGWFEFEDAMRHKRSLESQGYEVFVRSVSAYSTGGWFRDPILSTMLSDEDDAYRGLANVLLHELVHANVFVEDQSAFNESLASFVADALTDIYLVERFGADSTEVLSYRDELVASRQRGERFTQAYAELDRLYKSSVSDAVKRQKKTATLEGLVVELDLWRRPNNAVLVGFKTYNAGLEQFQRLLAACHDNWPRLLAATRSLQASHFAESQMEDMAQIIDLLVAGKCMPLR